jgi:hypothetical protein
MDSSPYLLVLFIGAVIVLLDGQLILRKSPAYLDEVYQNPARSRQLSALVTLLFHLVMLGFVALVASVGLGADPGPRAIIARTGVMLLLTAVGHAATIAILSRLRDQQLSTQIAETQLAESQAAQHERADRAAAARTERPRAETPRTEARAEAPRPEKPRVERSRDALPSPRRAAANRAEGPGGG